MAASRGTVAEMLMPILTSSVSNVILSFASTFSFIKLHISPSFSYYYRNYYHTDYFDHQFSVTTISLLISNQIVATIIHFHSFIFGHGYLCRAGHPVRKKWLHGICLALLGLAQISVSNSESHFHPYRPSRPSSFSPSISNRLVILPLSPYPAIPRPFSYWLTSGSAFPPYLLPRPRREGHGADILWSTLDTYLQQK